MQIKKRYVVNHPRQEVFEAWISPETLIPPVTRIEVDASVGGLMRLIVEGEEWNSVMQGTFRTIAKPETLIYTWEWNEDGEESIIRVDFNDLGDQTEILIEHSDFQKQTSMETHDTGWDSYVAGVEKLLQQSK